MNRQGPPGQSIRAMSGFPNQTAPQSRVGPLGSGRIQQSSKVANAPGWAFGMQNGSAQGLSGAPGRGPGNASSFAQTIGGSQSSAPLDLSEFPSLSGGSQPQYQNPGQAVWSAQRAAQQTPVGRPQQSPGNPLGSQSASVGHQAQEHAQQNLDDAFFSSSMNGAMDDYRHGGQGGVGQLSGSGQAQATQVEEFPPLGRLAHGDIGGDRRAAMMQTAAGGPFQGSSAPGFGTGQTNLSRTGSDSLRQDQNKDGQSLQNGMANARSLDYGMANNGLGRGLFASDTLPSDMQAGDQPKSPSDQPGSDRYGLNPLITTLRNQNTHAATLAIGNDLASLGLDLESQEPLHPTFAGPFATVPARPLQPAYTLPQCYTVSNTHPVEDKLNGLSDETLIWIFYNMPRDVLQETAAKELTERNWRYHKTLGLWLTKEANVPEPQLIAHEVERGRYIVFNHRNWTREQREMVIRYSDLDDHITINSQRHMMGH